MFNFIFYAIKNCDDRSFTFFGIFFAASCTAPRGTLQLQSALATDLLSEAPGARKGGLPNVAGSGEGGVATAPQQRC